MTPLQRAADALLASQGHGGVREFVESRRRDGQSWRQVVRALEDETGGAVEVTEVTLRTWMDAYSERGVA